MSDQPQPYEKPSIEEIESDGPVETTPGATGQLDG
jgi:hypothetical protein